MPRVAGTRLLFPFLLSLRNRRRGGEELVRGKKGEHACMRHRRKQTWHRPTRRDKAPETSKVGLADVMHNETFEPGATVPMEGLMPPPLPRKRREREIVSSCCSISSTSSSSTRPHLLAQASIAFYRGVLFFVFASCPCRAIPPLRCASSRSVILDAWI